MSHWAAGILPGEGEASLEMPAWAQGQKGELREPQCSHQDTGVQQREMGHL